MLSKILDRIRNEPVLVLNFIGALFTLLVVFGVPVSEEQKIAAIGFVGALLTLLTRQLVTPTKGKP